MYQIFMCFVFLHVKAFSQCVEGKGEGYYRLSDKHIYQLNLNCYRLKS